MSKLLNDEELKEKFAEIQNIAHAKAKLQLGNPHKYAQQELIDLINTQKRLYAKEIIGDSINIKFIPHDEYDKPSEELIKDLGSKYIPLTFPVCSTCGWWQNDPEEAHACAIINKIVEQQRARINL